MLINWGIRWDHKSYLYNYLRSQVGIDSNSLPVKEAITIAKNKLIKIIIINKNNENISPFENGRLLPTNF